MGWGGSDREGCRRPGSKASTPETHVSSLQMTGHRSRSPASQVSPARAALLQPRPRPAPRPRSHRPLPVPPGRLLALLVAGSAALVVAAIALGAWIWGRRRCGHKDAGERAGGRAGGRRCPQVPPSAGGHAPAWRRLELQPGRRPPIWPSHLPLLEGGRAGLRGGDRD